MVNKNIYINYINIFKWSVQSSVRACDIIVSVFIFVSILLPGPARASDDMCTRLDPVEALLGEIREPAPAHSEQRIPVNCACPECSYIKPEPGETQISFADVFIADMLHPVNFLTSVDRNLPAKSEPDVVLEEGDENRRNIRLARISALPGDENVEAKNKLNSWIKALRSIELNPPSEGKEDDSAPSSDVRTRKHVPQQPQLKHKTSGPDIDGIQIHQQTEVNDIDNHTLKVVDEFLSNPEQVNNPSELAEVLFASGLFSQAAVFYEEALRRSAEKNEFASERVWMLFQLANCQKAYDPPAARKTYSRLINLYPDCFWSKLAKAQEKLLAWYSVENPGELLSETGKIDANPGELYSDTMQP